MKKKKKKIEFAYFGAQSHTLSRLTTIEMFANKSNATISRDPHKYE